MPGRSDNTQTDTGSRPQRRRLRGMCSSKTGKAIGFTTIAAPIVGYIVNDLKKPDSIVRGLLGGMVKKLLPAKTEKVAAIDITDEVDILEENKDNNSL